MPEWMKHEVRNLEIEKMLYDLGHDLKKMMPPGWGFGLLVFSYGENGSMFYTSSAQREDMLKAMQEFVDKFRENR